jgi:cytochrome c-type biogenesis protein
VMRNKIVTRRPWFPAAAAIAIITLASACVSGENSQTEMPPQPAPDLTLVSLQGDTVSLAAERGNVVLLNIWATWCAPCREEMPLLQKLHARHRDAGLRVVGVSIDARGEDERIQRFLRDFSVSFPVWLDPDERASFLFRAIGVPATYLIDRKGEIVWKHLGPLTENDQSFDAAIARALRVE